MNPHNGAHTAILVEATLDSNPISSGCSAPPFVYIHTDALEPTMKICEGHIRWRKFELMSGWRRARTSFLDFGERVPRDCSVDPPQLARAGAGPANPNLESVPHVLAAPPPPAALLLQQRSSYTSTPKTIKAGRNPPEGTVPQTPRMARDLPSQKASPAVPGLAALT